MSTFKLPPILISTRSAKEKYQSTQIGLPNKKTFCGEIEQKLFFFGDHLPQFPAFEQSSSSINSRRPDLKMSSRNLALKYIYFI
jgi:hypothetical protein